MLSVGLSKYISSLIFGQDMVILKRVSCVWSKLVVYISDFVMDLMVGKETSVSCLFWIEVSSEGTQVSLDLI